MIIRHKKHERDFVQIHKLALNDPKLSFKAKGIHTYIMSKPDDWVVRIQDLVKHGMDGEEAIRSGLQNLEQQKYARLIRGGKDGGGHWVLFETPDLDVSNSPDAPISDMAVSATSPRPDMAVSPIWALPNLGFSDPTNNKGLLKNEEIVRKIVPTDSSFHEGRKRKVRSFVPPTEDQVFEYGCEIGCPETDCRSFVDWYSSVGWVCGKAKIPMIDWKAALRGHKRRVKENRWKQKSSA